MGKIVNRRIPLLFMLVIAVGVMQGCESKKPQGPAQHSQDADKKENSQASKKNQPLPHGAFSAMLEKVDRGEWTLEDGMITNLKIIAGELRSEDVYGDHAFESFEERHFLSLAQDYIESGKDAKAKTELKRLLNIIIPDIERLKRYSVPEGRNSGLRQESREPVGYSKKRDWLFPSAFAQDDDCKAAREAGFEERVIPPRKCFIYRDIIHSGYTHTIFYPADWEGRREIRFVNSTEEAITLSLEKYRSIASMTSKNIVSVFAWRQSGRNTLASTGHLRTTDEARECRVRIYPLARTLGPDELKQTIAHEIFHCFSGWNLFYPYYGRNLDGIWRARFSEAADWWEEGAAEYFGNVVYPCVNAERDFVTGFDARSASLSILHEDMDYENFVFFQYLGNRIGNDRIIGLLRRMPDRGGIDEQAAALAAYPNMAEIFHDFGRAYLDRNIADSCRDRKVDVHPRTHGDTITVFHGAEYPVHAKRFHLARRRLQFQGGRYEMKYHPDREPPKTAVKLEPGATWESPPERVNTECLERNYTLLVTYAVGGPPENEYVIRELNDLARERQVDPCLIGEWKAEPGSAESIGRWVADQRSGSHGSKTVSTEFLGVTGEISGRVTNGGRAFGRVSNIEQRYKMIGDDHSIVNMDSRFDIRVIISGNSCADYSADGRVLLVWNIAGDEKARAKVKGNIGGMPYNSDKEINLNELGNSFQNYLDSLPSSQREKLKGRVNLSEAGRLPSELKFGYRCRGNILEIDPPAESAGRPPWKFRKRP